MPRILFKKKELMILNEEGIEPVKVGTDTYGKQIIFHNQKRKIKFISKNSNSIFIPYKHIDKIELIRVNKKRLYILSVIFLFLFIGIFIAFITIYLPPWVLKIYLKDEYAPQKSRNKKQHKVIIRMKIDEKDAYEINEFFIGILPIKVQDYKHSG